MRRLVVFANRALNELRRRALRLDELHAAGLPAAYWDLSALCGLYPAEPSEVSRPYVRRFASWEEVDDALAAPGAPETLLVPSFIDEPGYFGALRRITKSQARLALPRLYSSPVPQASPAMTAAGRILGLARPHRLKAALVRRAALGLQALGLLRGFDLAITVGDAARAAVAGMARIPIHHCDFDDWRATAESDPRLVPGRYAVFLDMFYSGHPDHRIEGLPPVDAERYFRALNRLFERLELRHGLEIAVAAHPKAEYPANPFQGRKVFRLRTRELARHCEFALTTFSASMSYAVFGRKPIVFIDSDEMAVVHRPSGQHAWPRMYAEVLGGRYVNLDHPAAEDEALPPVDPRRYSDYVYRHLASRENEARSTFDVLSSYLHGEEPRP